jgi:autotransporter-associated beta strand protein
MRRSLTAVVQQNGTGTTVLVGGNSHAGGTILNGGILAVNGDGNLGTGPLSFNGGTLEALGAAGGIASFRAVNLAAGGGTLLADAGTFAPAGCVPRQVHEPLKERREQRKRNKSHGQRQCCLSFEETAQKSRESGPRDE